MRCRHGDGELTEEVRVVSAYGVRNGEVDPVAWHGRAEPTGLWTFECEVCGRMFQTRSPRKAPKWLREKIERVGE